jgi:hypothetical protein
VGCIAGALNFVGFKIDVLSLPFVGTVSLGALSLRTPDPAGELSLLVEFS